MRFATIFIFGFLILGCSSKDESRTESVFPLVASSTPAIEPQETSSPELEFECENINDILGFADISFDATTVLRFYAKPDASEKPAETLRFYEDRSVKSFRFRAEGDHSFSHLGSGAKNLDYDIFELAVKSRRNNWLEVVVDDQTDETLWLQEGKIVRFKDWLQDMKEAFAIGRIKSTVNPLRAKPNATAKEVTFNGRDCFEVEDMKGDWIQVKMQEHNCSENPKQSVSGWLRWRDENGCLLVEIFPFA